MTTDYENANDEDNYIFDSSPYVSGLTPEKIYQTMTTGVDDCYKNLPDTEFCFPTQLTQQPSKSDVAATSNLTIENTSSFKRSANRDKNWIESSSSDSDSDEESIFKFGLPVESLTAGLKLKLSLRVQSSEDKVFAKKLAVMDPEKIIQAILDIPISPRVLWSLTEPKKV